MHYAVQLLLTTISICHPAQEHPLSAPVEALSGRLEDGDVRAIVFNCIGVHFMTASRLVCI